MNVLVHHFHDEYNIMNIINLEWEGGSSPLSPGYLHSVDWNGVVEWSEALEWACDHFGESFRHFSVIEPEHSEMG